MIMTLLGGSTIFLARAVGDLCEICMWKGEGAGAKQKIQQTQKTKTQTSGKRQKEEKINLSLAKKRESLSQFICAHVYENFQ